MGFPDALMHGRIIVYSAQRISCRHAHWELPDFFLNHFLMIAEKQKIFEPTSVAYQMITLPPTKEQPFYFYSLPAEFKSIIVIL